MTGSIGFLILVVVFLNGWMYFQQPRMIFYPDRTLSATPANWGLEYEDVMFLSEDGVRLHGWYIPHRGSEQVLLFFHGNAGNISHRGDSVAIFHRLGLNVLIIDYRGYGRSEGVPGEQGLYRDARAAWAYLADTRRVQAEQVLLFGRSLGGVVAARLASEVQAGALILESTLNSSKDFARSVFPVLSRLVILRYGLNTGQYLSNVTCPVLVMHSPEDEIMPFALGEKVFQAANRPKEFVKLRGDHNSGFLASQPAYEQSLGEFITRYSPAAKEQGGGS